MKKNEFITAVAEKAGMTKKDTDAVVAAVSEVILEVIAKNDSVKLGDVCTFKGVDKPARDYRNPLTGGTVHKDATTGNPKCTFTKAAKA